MGGADQTSNEAKRGKRAKPAQLLHKIDRAQQRRPFLAVAVGTYKKFSDDQAGNLAALVAYYAFASVFPLLLVFFTVLRLIAHYNPSLRDKLLNSAVSGYPFIAGEISSSVQGGISSTGFALAIGVLLTLYAARGVATAIQNAMNTVWGVPQYQRPSFPWSLLRSFGLIGILGPGLIITISLSSLAGGVGILHGAGARVAAVAVSLILNIGLFWLGFRIATAKEVGWRDLLLSAILAAICWQVLQSLGGYFLAHQAKTKSAYGAFAVVIGLLAWFYLQAQLTLYVVELNVVRVRKLWPRTLVPPPLADADMRAYELYARASQRRPELEIEVRQKAAAAGNGDAHQPQ